MKRATLFSILFVLLAGGAGVWYFLRSRETLPADPLAIVPADAYGLARIRMSRVMASEAWKALVVARGHADSMQRVEQACGYNPLARLTDVILIARPNPKGGLPRLSFAARGDLQHEELIDCVEKVTGVESDRLQLEEIDGITTVASSGGNSRAAFVGRDGILGGDAESVRHLIAVLHKKAESVTDDPIMRELFRKVDSEAQDLVVAARLPDTLRPQLQKLSDGLTGGLLGPLAHVRAFAANARLANSRIAGTLSLLGNDEKETQAVVALAQQQIRRLMAIPGLSMTPAAGVLREIKIEALGTRATFSGAIRVSTLEGLIDLLPAFVQMRDTMRPGGGPTPGSSAPTPPPGVPDVRTEPTTDAANTDAGAD